MHKQCDRDVSIPCNSYCDPGANIHADLNYRLRYIDSEFEDRVMDIQKEADQDARRYPCCHFITVLGVQPAHEAPSLEEHYVRATPDTADRVVELVRYKVLEEE